MKQSTSLNPAKKPSKRNVARVGGLLIAATATLGLSACSTVDAQPDALKLQPISKAEVRAAQENWGDGIVAIGNVFQNGGDYTAQASNHIKTLYAYDRSEVLFKPTLAADDQFRETFGGALSYFVTGEVAEDKGFAIKPWSAVRFGEQQIITDLDSATAMGNYFFTPVGSVDETKVEFTFGYMRDENGDLRINVHHSSLPHSR